MAEIRERDSYTDLMLSSVPGIDGKSTRLYFHCPYCGKRVRYLYRRQEHYMCRNCAKLNYASQQKSGMDEMRLKMERIVEKKLGYTKLVYGLERCIECIVIKIMKYKYMIHKT